MARLIDAEALIAKAERVYNYGLVVSVDDINDAPTVIEGIVGEIPSADVAPVKHGEWVYNENGCISCSICKKHYAFGSEIWNKSENRYCRWCGAKMDGGKG